MGRYRFCCRSGNIRTVIASDSIPSEKTPITITYNAVTLISSVKNSIYVQYIEACCRHQGHSNHRLGLSYQLSWARAVASGVTS
jgi:hypothetical protein